MRAWILAGLLVAWPMAARAGDWVSDKPAPGSFPVATPQQAAEIVYDSHDAAVVGIAAHDLAGDVARVTGEVPVVADGGSVADRQIWIGTAGHNAAIDSLIRRGRLDTAKLKDCWECFVIQTINHPVPGVAQALVIAGSDRRGTAYGVYELSQAMGVSPWYWWADVAPARKDAVYVSAGTCRFGPPSVKYRGIFINDEDWGLKPWVATTFDPQKGNFGPKTYAKVFELLLRLKADTLWPAMHEVSAPFNSDPDNAALADRYAIVMGSSHAEPMLRNNVGEWKDKPEAFNYATNPEGVKAYWQARLQANGKYENLYTLGMRGIHDSGMVGASTPQGRRDLLDKVLHDQRQLLGDNVSKDVVSLPQIFVPYKEVLDVYRLGLDLPDDVTLVWPDDNFGYIRQFPNAIEQARSGHSGVYYHLSYLGAPLSYIWLSTMPPALINEEMTRVYDHGADRVWIANVGDIKPAEVSLSYFLDLAWDVKGTRALSQRDYLRGLAGRMFGPDQMAIGDIWDQYYQLNFARRPEHLQWNFAKESPRPSSWSGPAIDARLTAFDHLAADVAALRPGLRAAQADSFFELVDYPVTASAQANHRYFDLECLYEQAVKTCGPTDPEAAAHAADTAITDLTVAYNQKIADGKWNGIMKAEPADGQWTSFRIRSPLWPGAAVPMAVAAPENVVPVGAARAEGWDRIEGLGASGVVLKARADAQPLDYDVTPPEGAGWRLRLVVLPTYAADGQAWRMAVQIDNGPVQTVTFDHAVDSHAWAEGVLSNRLTAEIATVPGGKFHVRLMPMAPDIIVEGLELVRDQPAK